MRGKLVSIKLQRARYVALDWGTSTLGFFIFNIFRYFLLSISAEGLSLSQYLCSGILLIEQIGVPLVMLGIFWISGYYNNPFGKSRLEELSTTLISTGVSTVGIYLTLLINDQLYGRTISYELLTMLMLCLFTPVYIGRLSLTQHAIRNFHTLRWGFNTVMIGDSDKSMQTADRLRKTQSRLGYDIMSFVPIEGEKSSNRPHSTISHAQLETLCRNRQVDQILIVTEKSDDTSLLHLIFSYIPLNVPIRLAPNELQLLSSTLRTRDVYAEPFVDVTAPSVSDFTKNLKRVIDVTLSAAAMLLIWPVMAVAAIAVKRSSPGPVFYSQERIGYRQQPFKIYKFRTMVQNAESDGPRLSDDNDPRITRAGHIMRKYRIGELPQLSNVLKGDMSLVGPRPEREFFIRQIVEKAPYYTLIHQVRPGLTSWGMVKFGYAKNVSEMVERTRYDIMYISNMSILMDFKIMIHTVKTVFSGKGV